jgi:hypothetical protein
MVSNWTTCGKLQNDYQEWGFSQSSIVLRVPQKSFLVSGFVANLIAQFLCFLCLLSFIKSEKINTCKQALAIVNSEKASCLL